MASAAEKRFSSTCGAPSTCRTQRRKSFQFISLSALAASTLVALAQPAQVHTVDLSVTHQTWDNFGASDAWTSEQIGHNWSLANRPQVSGSLFSKTNGIGLSAWRFNLGGGVDDSITNPWRTVDTYEIAPGRYDWTRCPGQRWFLSSAKAYGVPTFIAFANSPPRRLTRNGHTYGTDGLGSTNLREGAEAEYARYLVDILRHFRDDAPLGERVAFDCISPVNEPQWEWNGIGQEGNRASNADLVRIYSALRDELARQGVATKILGVESGSLTDMYQQTANNDTLATKYGAPYGDYIWRLVTDPDQTGVSGWLDQRLAYHGYWSDDPASQLLPDRQSLRQEMATLAPDWRLWMTEYCVLGPDGPGRDLGIETALRVARVIQLDLAVTGVSAWQWWTAISAEDYKDGLVYTDWKANPDRQWWYASKTLWAMGQFSRYIRPGMKRCGFTGEGADPNGLLGSAWRDESTGEIVVVYVNLATNYAPVKLSFKGLVSPFAPVIVRSYVTSGTAGDDIRPAGTRLVSDTLQIQPRSVTTLRIQPRPGLTVTSDTTPGYCRVSWPSWADGWILQSSTNSPPAAWTAVSATATTTNGSLRARVPVDGAQRFFRLAAP